MLKFHLYRGNVYLKALINLKILKNLKNVIFSGTCQDILPIYFLITHAGISSFWGKLELKCSQMLIKM